MEKSHSNMNNELQSTREMQCQLTRSHQTDRLDSPCPNTCQGDVSPDVLVFPCLRLVVVEVQHDRISHRVCYHHHWGIAILGICLFNQVGEVGIKFTKLICRHHTTDTLMGDMAVKTMSYLQETQTEHCVSALRAAVSCCIIAFALSIIWPKEKNVSKKNNVWATMLHKLLHWEQWA